MTHKFHAFLTAILVLPGCTTGELNSNRTGENLAGQDIPLLQSFAVNASAFDFQFHIWMVNPIVSLIDLNTGVWDGSAVRETQLSDGCTVQSSTPVGTFGLRHTQELAACPFGQDENGNVGRTSGKLVSEWQGTGNTFAATVSVPSQQQTFPDNTKSEFSGNLKWTISQETSDEGTTVFGRQQLSVAIDDELNGVASFETDIRVALSQFDVFLLNGQWTYTQNDETINGVLDNVVMDLRDDRVFPDADSCFFSDENGNPIPQSPPVMPVGGTIEITIASETRRLQFGSCTATVVVNGEPIAFFDGSSQTDAIEFLTSYGASTPGLYDLRILYKTGVDLALHTRRWCDNEENCFSLAYAGGSSADPLFTSLLGIGTYQGATSSATTATSPLTAITDVGLYSSLLNTLAFVPVTPVAGIEDTAFFVVLDDDATSLEVTPAGASPSTVTLTSSGPALLQTSGLSPQPPSQLERQEYPLAAAHPGTFSRSLWTGSGRPGLTPRPSRFPF